MRKKSGFTIVELLIVLIIVGILFAIGSRVFYNIEGSKIETTKAELSTLKGAFNSFITDYGNIIVSDSDSNYDDIMDEIKDTLNHDYLDYDIAYSENDTLYSKTVAVLISNQQRDEWGEPYVIFINTSDDRTAPAGKIYIVSGGSKKITKINENREDELTQIYNNFYDKTKDNASDGIFTLDDGSIAATILPH